MSSIIKTTDTTAAIAYTYTNTKGDDVTIELPVTTFALVHDTILAARPYGRYLNSKDTCFAQDKDAFRVYAGLCRDFTDALAPWALRKAKGISDEVLKPLRNEAFEAFKSVVAVLSAGQVVATNELFDALVVRGLVYDKNMDQLWMTITKGDVSVRHMVEATWATVNGRKDHPMFFTATGWKLVRKAINKTKAAQDALENGVKLHDAGKIGDADLDGLNKAYNEALEAEVEVRRDNCIDLSAEDDAE